MFAWWLSAPFEWKTCGLACLTGACSWLFWKQQRDLDSLRSVISSLEERLGKGVEHAISASAVHADALVLERFTLVRRDLMQEVQALSDHVDEFGQCSTQTYVSLTRLRQVSQRLEDEFSALEGRFEALQDGNRMVMNEFRHQLGCSHSNHVRLERTVSNHLSAAGRDLLNILGGLDARFGMQFVFGAWARGAQMERAILGRLPPHLMRRGGFIARSPRTASITLRHFFGIWLERLVGVTFSERMALMSDMDNYAKQISDLDSRMAAATDTEQDSDMEALERNIGMAMDEEIVELQRVTKDQAAELVSLRLNVEQLGADRSSTTPAQGVAPQLLEEDMRHQMASDGCCS